MLKFYSEGVPRSVPDRVHILHQYLADLPESKPGESENAYINRVVANLSQDEASELITNLTIEQQANTLATYLPENAAQILDITARAEFQKPFAQTNRHERTRLQKALQRNLTQQKLKPSNQQPGTQLAAGTD